MSDNMGRIKIIGNSHIFFDGQFLEMCKNPPKLVAELNFCNFTLGTTTHQKNKSSFAAFVCFFSLWLAQLSELLPPVLVVETPHVA